MPLGLRACLAVVYILAHGGAALAQSGIGFEGGETALAADAAGLASARLSGNFRITGHHGAQIAVSATQDPDSWHGSLEGHLYLLPGNGLSYGLYGQLSDRNDQDTWALATGAEVQVPLGAATSAEIYAGLGLAPDPVQEFLQAGVAVSHRVGPDFWLDATLDLAAFDEAQFSANLATLALGVSFMPEHAPLGAFARIERQIWSGQDAPEGETRAIAGITVRFGQPPQHRSARPFRSRDMIAPLIAAGVF
jgi:hypothetical protein